MSWEQAGAAATVVATLIAAGVWLTGGASPIASIRHARERRELEHRLKMQRIQESLKPGQSYWIEETHPGYFWFLAVMALVIGAVIAISIIWGEDDAAHPTPNASIEARPTHAETQKAPGD